MLSHVFCTRPRVTSVELSFKRRRHDKEIMECEGELSHLEVRLEAGQSCGVVCKDIEVDPRSVQQDLFSIKEEVLTNRPKEVKEEE
ncbi:hypothetical protein FNV43_RR05672 [Rhamnella rubrinervis]|uniref:Uncharacterized protein n=1 Tax=Rhamnella rubrinervis TaxID=2594499 RepID=A0A8K0MRB8_9ROSA|nr:hypothetical protein FNV43_RR05672 [Rhamnella rubrinervis]